MATSGSYDVDKQHRDAKSEIERLAAQARLGWNKEARTLAWFGLKDGMSVIELGSGPGFITRQLSALLPTSPITCLEISPQLLAQAKQYLQESGNRVNFIEGSVMDMQLAANSYDFAYARLLFQHLPDPYGAVKEIWRILKPGGRLVIYDIDDEMYGLIEPPVPEYSKIIKKFGQVQASMGGNRHIGRSLWRILKTAGFINLDLEVITAHSDAIGIEPFLPQIDPDRLLPLLKQGFVTEAELKGLRAAREKYLASPQPYILVASMLVRGEKPIY